MIFPETMEAASFADHPVLHLSAIAVVVILIAGALVVRRSRR
jgi:hypothetical protein